MREATVLLGVDDPGLQDEVLDYLDRRPSVRVVGAASSPEGIGHSVRERRPDAVVGTPDVAVELSASEARVLVVDRRETTEGLRKAIRAGAQGFYVWPDEREALGRDAAAARRSGDDPSTASGTVIAVYPGRGGAGGTFVATNLAAAFAGLGASALLADLDVMHGDVASVVAGIEGSGSMRELEPVVDEIGPEHVDRLAGTHPSGCRVLAAEGDGGAALPAALVAGAVTAMRRSFDVTVLHLPRAIDEAVRTAVDRADVVLIVATLDVPAVRSVQRMLSHLDDGGLAGRCRLVLNRATRGEIVPADAVEALGMPVAAVIPFDRAVPRSQNRGHLVVGRSGPAARRMVRLARTLLRPAEVAA